MPRIRYLRAHANGCFQMLHPHKVKQMLLTYALDFARDLT